MQHLCPDPPNSVTAGPQVQVRFATLPAPATPDRGHSVRALRPCVPQVRMPSRAVHPPGWHARHWNRSVRPMPGRLILPKRHRLRREARRDTVRPGHIVPRRHQFERWPECLHRVPARNVCREAWLERLHAVRGEHLHKLVEAVELPALPRQDVCLDPWFDELHRHHRRMQPRHDRECGLQPRVQPSPAC